MDGGNGRELIMHKTEIVEIKQASDECLAVRIRCCDDPLTDSVLTVYRGDENRLAADIEKHHDKVAAKHAGMQSGKHLLDTVVMKTKTHEAT
jgi:hypothetical protein